MSGVINFWNFTEQNAGAGEARHAAPRIQCRYPDMHSIDATPLQ